MVIIFVPIFHDYEKKSDHSRYYLFGSYRLCILRIEDEPDSLLQGDERGKYNHSLTGKKGKEYDA